MKNANYEGIPAANAVDVTISGNTVTGNNRGLNYSAGTCAGQLRLFPSPLAP